VDAADYHSCRPREKRPARENTFSKTAGNRRAQFAKDGFRRDSGTV
jgi:hypothetical protein